VTILAVIAFVAFVGWSYTQWRKISRRLCRDLALHDFRAISGTNLEECHTPGCNARQWRQP
jgi:hypothetical protein